MMTLDGGVVESDPERLMVATHEASRDYAARYEPSADDFLSPALVEALLMKDDARAALLLNKGLPDVVPNDGSLLAFARTPFAIDRLLALGASPTQKDRWGATPIEAMSRAGADSAGEDAVLVRHRQFNDWIEVIITYAGERPSVNTPRARAARSTQSGKTIYDRANPRGYRNRFQFANVDKGNPRDGADSRAWRLKESGASARRQNF